MYDNEFFVVDMASCTSTGEIVNSLSLALETLNHSGKKIVLKLNDTYLNQSQLLSIQSLVTSYGCILDTIETINKETAQLAENMNIFVQKPIEKRVEEKYISNEEKTSDFIPFNINTENKSEIIPLKEANETHFQANLDALAQAQSEIDIQKDLLNAGINPNADFENIEKQISSQYIAPDDIVKTVEEFSKINNSLLDDFKAQEIKEEIKEEEKEDENEETQEELQDVEKNSIGVYKKAYDEYEAQEDQWEDVDFYETPTTDPVVSDSKNTTYINQTLRSGQVLESDGNVVIIGDCHPGSEIRAIGDITVWGVLSGIAHAGCKGNLNAKVRALKLNAVQLRIGNCYSRRPDGTNIPYIIKSSIFTPEEARVVDNEIMLFKINQN
ncbi:MAG: hypothetical protein IJD57_02145 [Candidatus Gastranaerophilales bacterium]|nr:hypothetical protein [Candidatus Gastranaerophilales bacterium]